MPYLIGTDEAGYGPNLGPLTIGGSLWAVSDSSVSLYDSLAGVVTPKAEREKLVIADSKVVYSSSGSIKRLETSVLSVLYAMYGEIPSSWEQLQRSLNVKQDASGDPWLQSNELTLPMAAEPNEIKALGEALRQQLERSGVELSHVACKVIFPQRFNRLVDELGNKATLLTNETLSLVRELRSRVAHDQSLKIVCDKHGGRSHYADVINTWLTDAFVWTEEEGRSQSNYRWVENETDVGISFVSKGESFLPVALSSMLAKYTREVFMEIWNTFWCLKIPDLKPTKGYPQDAKRFKKSIAKAQSALGIQDELIWRVR